MENGLLTKIVANRFIRAFASGFISTIATAPLWSGNLRELKTWIIAIIISGLIGGLMALDKLRRTLAGN